MIAEEPAILVINDRLPTIRLNGDLTSRHARPIAQAFRSLTARGHECICVDAQNLGDVEAGCIAALARGAAYAQARGVSVKWAHASRRLRELLRCVLVSDHRESMQSRACQSAAGRKALELPCLPQSVALIRANVAEMASLTPFTTIEVDDIVLAVGEAAANAVRHGLRFGEDCLLRVNCQADPESFAVEITDPGDGFDPETLRLIPTSGCREGGMGIYLMRRVMDEVSYTFDSRGTTVRLVKRVHPPRGIGS